MPTEIEQTDGLQQSSHTDSSDNQLELNTLVTDELYDQLLDQVAGARIVGLVLWEESLADEMGDSSPKTNARELVDMDLYLENHVSMELYGVTVHTGLDNEPLHGLTRIDSTLAGAVEKGLWLDEIAVNDQDELVLVLVRNHQPQLYLIVGGWSLAEWDELPQVD